MNFIILRNVAQVMFQDSPLTGGLFLIGIGLACFVNQEFSILVCALSCAIIANFTAFLLRANLQFIRNGLYGYNAVLIGIAGAVFLRPSALMASLLVMGAILSVLLMYLVLEKAPKKMNFPALTFPFLLITWVILSLVQNYFPELKGIPPSSSSTDVFIQGPLNSFSQVFLLEDSFTGALILIGLFLTSWLGGFYSLLAVVLTFLVAYGRGLSPELLGKGLFSYNAILTAIALGSVFLEKGKEAMIGTIMGIALTLIYQEFLGDVLTYYELPILTAPFVFAVWTILGARIFFQRTLKRPLKKGPN